MSDHEPQSFTTDRRFPWLILHVLGLILMVASVWTHTVEIGIVGAAIYLHSGANIRAIRREMVERGLEL